MALHGVHALMTLFTLCANLGAPPGGGEGVSSPLLPRAAGTAALEALRELAGWCVPEARTWGPIAALEGLSRRDDLVHAPYVFAYATYSRPEGAGGTSESGARPAAAERGEGVRRLRFGRIPGVAGPSGRGSVLGGTGLALSRRRRDPTPALAFAGFLTGAAVQAAMALHGGQPARRCVWQDATVDGACGGFYADTLPTIEGAYLRPRRPGMGRFQEAAGAALGDWLDGASPASEALETLNRLFDRHVSRPA
jgi:multiple sugar transport system substrate-binding protein